MSTLKTFRTVDPSEGSTHEEVWLLLPWYANGTLRGQERARVEAHLGHCDACRRELEIETAMRTEIQREPQRAASPEIAFERLRERIQRETRRPRPASAPSRRPPRHWIERLGEVISSMGWRPALVAVPALALMLLVPVLLQAPTGPSSGGDQGYHTLAGPDVATAQPNDIQLIFAPQTSMEAVRSLIASIRGQVVAGPSSVGAYTVRLSAEDAAGQDLSAVIGTLKRHPEVIFAEAAQPIAVPRQDAVRQQ